MKVGSRTIRRVPVVNYGDASGTILYTGSVEKEEVLLRSKIMFNKQHKRVSGLLSINSEAIKKTEKESWNQFKQNEDGKVF